MSSAKPFTQVTGDVWINGSFVPVAEAHIPLLSHGLHYASCVFEGERAYGGHIFKSEEHTRRLMNSCNLLGFDFPFSLEEFEQAKYDAIARNGFTNAYLRPIAWKGSGPLGVGSSVNRVNVAIATWEMDGYFSDKPGVRLALSDWRRPPPVCAPVKAKAAGLYTICTISKDASLKAGYDDALMLDYEGRIAECTGAHIFFVKDGELYTPRSDWILEGITRATVIEIAKARGITVHQEFIQPEQMQNATECFIVGSAVEIMPVLEIAGQTFTPGDVTARIRDDYNTIKYGRSLQEPATS